MWFFFFKRALFIFFLVFILVLKMIGISVSKLEGNEKHECNCYFLEGRHQKSHFVCVCVCVPWKKLCWKMQRQCQNHLFLGPWCPRAVCCVYWSSDFSLKASQLACVVPSFPSKGHQFSLSVCKKGRMRQALLPCALCVCFFWLKLTVLKNDFCLFSRRAEITC